jgi:4-amino-4-deoxy-L-arabinose transferase-like glycosyltransferase
MRPLAEATLLVAACAALYLTGTGDIPFYTRGEPREGLVVREMLATGEWLVPARPEGEPARKPPLYYWSAALAARALPRAPERALRLPSAVYGTLGVLGTWGVARAAWGAAAGLPAALIVATTFEWMRAATSARVDMTLTAALTALLAGWILALVRGRGWLVLALAGATAGVLAKGPVALVLAGLAAAGFLAAVRERAAWRRLRPVLVLALAAAAAGLWYAAAYLRIGPEFLDVVARENWLRFVDTESAKTGHEHALGYLVPLGLVGLLPWTPLLPLALAPLGARPRPHAVTLAAAWVVTGVLFFSLAAAQRSVYLLPLFPALALLLGAGVAAAPETGRLARAARLGAGLYAPAMLLLAAVAGAYAAGLDPGLLLRRWLTPRDAAGAATLAEAARAARLPLGLLAAATALAAPLLARAARRASWQRLVRVLAALAVLWTVTFDAVFHPAIARGRSLASFFVQVDGMVGRTEPLYAFFPPDPGLRFYASRAARATRARRAAPRPQKG